METIFFVLLIMALLLIISGVYFTETIFVILGLVMLVGAFIYLNIITHENKYRCPTCNSILTETQYNEKVLKK